jgi:hypothetical protein
MKSLVVSIVIAASLAACSSDSAFNVGQHAELLKHETQWQHRDFHSYSYDAVTVKFGRTDSLHITVVNDVVTGVTGTSDSVDPVDPSDAPTIDALFHDADSALSQKGVSVALEFNDELGYVSLYETEDNNPGGGYSAKVYNLAPQQ